MVYAQAGHFNLLRFSHTTYWNGVTSQQAAFFQSLSPAVTSSKRAADSATTQPKDRSALGSPRPAMTEKSSVCHNRNSFSVCVTTEIFLKCV